MPDFARQDIFPLPTESKDFLNFTLLKLISPHSRFALKLSPDQDFARAVLNCPGYGSLYMFAGAMQKFPSRNAVQTGNVHVTLLNADI